MPTRLVPTAQSQSEASLAASARIANVTSGFGARQGSRIVESQAAGTVAHINAVACGLRERTPLNQLQAPTQRQQ